MPENFYIYGTDNGEDIMGGSGQDSLIGNGGNDFIWAEAGDDYLEGGSEADYLYGEDGNDTYAFTRGSGHDAVYADYFGEGNVDIILIKGDIAPADVRVSRRTTSAGPDTALQIHISDSDSITLLRFFAPPSGTEKYKYAPKYKLVFESTGLTWDHQDITNQLFAGTEGSQFLEGWETGNNISALGGNDTVYGHAGNDTLNGGTGDDQLFGGADNDRIIGGFGADTLSGDAGTDVLEGGHDNDTYILADNDAVIELAGQGIDTIQASVSTTLISNVEKLVLTGTANINGTGTANADDISGNSGANHLWGLAGNDTLRAEGSAPGADSLYGGQGDDTYFIGSTSVAIIEVSNEGTDSVTIGFGGSYTLSSNVENGRVNNNANFTLNGNTGRNSLFGGGGNDTISGFFGADILSGGIGNDVLRGDAGVDRLGGGKGNDTYIFEAGDGMDFINDSSVSSYATETDTLEFLSLTQDQLWFERDGFDLLVTVNGEIDAITVSNWYSGPECKIERFVTADTDKVLTVDRVDALVSAMASMTKPTGNAFTVPASQTQQFNAAIAAAWQ